VIKQNPLADPTKGKEVVSFENLSPREERRRRMGKTDQGEHARWSKPPQGWTKLNVDGAWSMESKKGGIGMILRDDEGSILFTACKFLQSCDTPLEAELCACKEGLTRAMDLTGKPIWVECDSLEATSLIKDVNLNRSHNASLINEIKSLCAGERECRVTHVRRELNYVSHTLAKLSFNSACSMVWIRHGPDIIRSACIHDGTPMP
jgi:ribonuclease HI